MVMTLAEQLAALTGKIHNLTARHIALEAVVEHVVAPVLLAVVPQLSLKLVTAARKMEFRLPSDSSMRLSVEEHINPLVDRLERIVRS